MAAAPGVPLAREVAAALKVGAVVPPLRACVASMLSDASDHDHETAALLIDDLLDSGEQYWTEGTKQTALECLGLLPEGERRARYLERCHRITPRRSAGYVNALIDTQRRIGRDPVGLVVPLHVGAQPWAGRHEFAGQVDMDLENAFSQGVRVAHRYLIQRGVTGLSGALFLKHRSYQGQFYGVSGATGPSIGLAAGIGVLASLLDSAVPGEFGFTGEVQADGSVSAVGGLPAKLSAARDEQLDLVFCPKQPLPFAGPAVRQVEGFTQVVDAVFDRRVIDDGVARIRDKARGLAPEQVRWLLEEDEAAAESRVLISLVGNTDPYARDPETKALREPLQEGNVLAIASHLGRLSTAYLLVVPGEAPAGGNYTELAEQTRRELERRGAAVVVLPVTASDPTEFLQTFIPLRDQLYVIVDDIRTRHRPESTAVYLNATGGAPQLRLLLHLLVEQGVVPGRWLQVQRPQHIAAGGSRVRRVVLPPALQ